MKKTMRFVTSTLVAVISAGALLGAAGPGATPAPAPGEPTLKEVRQATARFKDEKVALAEGYIRDPFNVCETADMMGKPAAAGSMGIHYFRPDLLGVTEPPSPRVRGNGTHTDFRKPAALIYEPQADGSVELVAAENLVFADAWKAAGHTQPPSFNGVPYDTMIDEPATPLDEAHNFAPHYNRHVWIYRNNPNGVLTPFNPKVSCAAHKGSPEHANHTAH